MVKRANSFMIGRLNPDTGELYREFEFVKTIEEAETLSQYIMSYKSVDEIAIIIPQSNIAIGGIPEYYNEAKLLAKRYISEDSTKCSIMGPARKFKNLLKALSKLLSIVSSGKDVEVCEKKN